MNIMLLNKRFEEIKVIDTYESFIWTDRYYEAGDFELILPLAHYPNEMQTGSYLTIPNSEHVMIVEDISLVKDSESGNKVTVTGRSLESILDRRVIYEFSYLKGKFVDAIQNLLNNSIIKPTEPYRKISRFQYVETTDESILNADIDAQYFGIPLYEAITALCRHYAVGFKITIGTSASDGLYMMNFQLYRGKDRSLEDSNNTGNFVVFSEAFGNMIKEEYLESTKDFKNAALVGGEGEGEKRVCAETELHEIPYMAPFVGRFGGLERREMFVDANGVTSEGITEPTDYEQMLKSAGWDELVKHSVTRSLNGEVETLKQFKYGRDFSLGDTVQIENEFATSTRARIIEVTFSDSVSGYEVYQTLQSINIGDYGEVV